MKILKKNMKKGFATIKVENPDDLWYLSQIIEAGDHIKAKTLRKITTGGKEERSSKQVRKSVFIKILVEKVEFHKYSSSLRVLGTIVEAPPDIPNGSHHTITLEEGSVATILKEEWLNYQQKRLMEASVQRGNPILLMVHDREQAIFALLKNQGYEVLSELSGDVEKKAENQVKPPSFYRELAKILKDYAARHKVSAVIIASPAFWKEDFLKELGDTDANLRKIINLATCSSVTRPAIEEILKRPELSKVLKEERVAREAQLVEELLSEISGKAGSGMAAYGISEVKEAVDAGAVKMLLVTDGLIMKKRGDNTFAVLEKIMKNAESMKGDVVIVSSENEPGKKLDGLGGVGALLRYKMSY